jgi:hypothetical protein
MKKRIATHIGLLFAGTLVGVAVPALARRQNADGMAAEGGKRNAGWGRRASARA